MDHAIGYRRFAVIGMTTILAGASLGFGAEPGEGRFYRAYYAEHADRDYQVAADLYADVARDGAVDGAMRRRAQTRLAVVREELASRDLARLMPPNTLAYLEITRPGDQLMKLLSQLGLLSDGGLPPAEGGRRVRISPSLIRESMGIRGAAVAITGFDPRKGIPSGVLVFHHGNVEVIRGLIETGLPMGAKLVEPLEGYPTYDVEGQVLVTLTPRLVIASPQRSRIHGVLRRLAGEDTSSLATTKTVAEYMARRDDSLCFFMVNAKAVMPMVKMAVAGSGGVREMAMADALLDLDSFQSLVGQVGVGDDGVEMELALRLDAGHRSLVYNFLRTPAVDKGMLRCVPEGVAAFAVGALNAATAGLDDDGSPGEAGAAVVTALDIGREIFGNITSFSLYAAPPVGDSVRAGRPIPDVGLVLRVKDATRSEALWTQMLGIASLAGGGGNVEGDAATIDGVRVRSFGFPGAVTVYFGTVGHDVLIGSSRSALARSIGAKRGGRSVLDDASFADALQRLGPRSTKGVFVHAGRCARIARPFMQGEDAAEMDRFMDKLSDTVISLAVEHSDRVLRVSAGVRGLPEVGDVIAGLIEAEASRHELRRGVAQATSRGDWDAALAAIDGALKAHPDDTDALRMKFEVLAVGKKDRSSAVATSDAIYRADHENATALNNFAWSLLTEARYGGAYADVALRFAQRCNELTKTGNWMFVDTLALATFETGDAAAAVALEKKAMALSDGAGMKEMKAALARFEAGADDGKLAGGTP